MECSKCGAIKEQAAFISYRDANGVARRRGVCQKCAGTYAHENFDRLQQWRREYNAKTKTKRQLRAAKLRAEAKKIVDDFKNRPCVDCGRTWPPIAMDLDHPEGGKVLAVSKMASCAYKPERLLVELAKCEVVCACCHRLRTHSRGENTAPRRHMLPERKLTGTTRKQQLPSASEVDLPYAVDLGK